jgi:hypothetical protein
MGLSSHTQTDNRAIAPGTAETGTGNPSRIALMPIGGVA